MTNNEFPILEFDEDRIAFIRPENIIKPVDIPENCVLCFFAEAIEKILADYPHRTAAFFKSEGINFPVYELDYKSNKIALVQAAVGAPMAAGQIEELTVLGCKKYISCGSCGVLQKEIAVGHLIIPISAIRDEGTSYHYIKPSREIQANTRVVQILEDTMLKEKVPHIKAKTWTTDAFYRETPLKIQRRKAEGCVTVEMEASAYIAAAQYNNVDFGQILYAGDNLGGDAWDSRGYNTKTEIREFVLRLSLDACLGL